MNDDVHYYYHYNYCSWNYCEDNDRARCRMKSAEREREREAGNRRKMDGRRRSLVELWHKGKIQWKVKSKFLPHVSEVKDG